MSPTEIGNLSAVLPRPGRTAEVSQGQLQVGSRSRVPRHRPRDLCRALQSNDDPRVDVEWLAASTCGQMPGVYLRCAMKTRQEFAFQGFNDHVTDRR